VAVVIKNKIASGAERIFITQSLRSP
jgi:hypothetical protein